MLAEESTRPQSDEHPATLADRRQEFEHELINRKITWLLTSQTLLFAAYALGFGTEKELAALREALRDVFAYCGLAISALVFVGVVVHTNSKRLAWRKAPKAPWGVSTPNTVVGVIADALMPVVFIVAWSCIIVHAP